MKRKDWGALLFFTAAALAAQAVYQRYGFEEETALPLVGPAMFMPPLVLLTALLYALVRTRPLAKLSEQAAEDVFVFNTPALLAGVAGVFALLLGGILTLLNGETLHALCSMLTAVCAFYVIFTLRSGAQAESMMFLPPVFFLAVRLLLRYREQSYDPVRGHYYIELLALMALTATYLMVASFAYRCGRPKAYAVTAWMCVVLCACAAAQGLGLGLGLLFFGHGAVQLSFLAAAQSGSSAAQQPPQP